MTWKRRLERLIASVVIGLFYFYMLVKETILYVKDLFTEKISRWRGK